MEACQSVEEIEQPDGTKQKQLVLNPETVWWKTNLINAPTFGRFALELKEWERMATDAFDNMHKDRALSIARDIMDISTSYRRSIDAKSSESIRDKNNTQSTLIDKINRNKIEKAYTVKGEAKKTLLDGLFGREAEKEKEED